MPGGGHGIIPAPGTSGNYNYYLGIMLAEFPYILGNNFWHDFNILRIN
jgi:hypothetical protein